MSDAGSMRSPDSPRSQKKPANPRTKSAVRAKSGCYTCRIRRKKCDEKPNAEGKCETCVRLRLQCLGFGAKRPDWMRENNNVQELRDKIKTFLASQGMIKGHSGTPRPADREPSVLVLQEDANSGTTSPPRRTMSVSPNERGPPGLTTSFVREGGRYSNNSIAEYPNYSHPPPPLPQQQSLSPNAPLMTRTGPLTTNNTDIMLSPYSTRPSAHLSHHDNLVANNSAATDWNHQHAPMQAHAQPQASYRQPIPYPNIVSSFGTLYQTPIMEEDEYVNPNRLVAESNYALTVATPTAQYSMNLIPQYPLPESHLDYYMRNIPRKQYILVDASVDYILRDLANQSEAARSAMEFLASVHQQCTHRGRQILSLEPGTKTFQYHQKTKNVLQAALHNGTLSAGDAMAGLHSVSSILFSGGRGEWEFFLNVAREWVAQVLKTSDWLYGRNEHTQFLVRTTFWFDVIASITQCKAPRFVAEYERLFGFHGAYIGEAGSSAFSMLEGMGCDNDTFLALAKTSELAAWKQTQMSRFSLSAPELVTKGREIESQYLLRRTPTPPLPQEAAAGPVQSLAVQRRMTADVFRAAAKVFLHSVISGELPRCTEITEGVRETIEALQRVPKGTLAERSVVRSVVFPICIAGCLTEERRHQQFLTSLLQGQQQEAVGNCLEVANVMRTVWERRGRGQAANWRDVMIENGKGAEMLLLV